MRSDTSRQMQHKLRKTWRAAPHLEPVVELARHHDCAGVVRIDLLHNVHPQAAAPLHAALLQEQDEAVRRGTLRLHHGHDVVGGAVRLAFARLQHIERGGAGRVEQASVNADTFPFAAPSCRRLRGTPVSNAAAHLENEARCVDKRQIRGIRKLRPHHDGLPSKWGCRKRGNMRQISTIIASSPNRRDSLLEE